MSGPDKAHMDSRCQGGYPGFPLEIRIPSMMKEYPDITPGNAYQNISVIWKEVLMAMTIRKIVLTGLRNESHSIRLYHRVNRRIV